MIRRNANGIRNRLWRYLHSSRKNCQFMTNCNKKWPETFHLRRLQVKENERRKIYTSKLEVLINFLTRSSCVACSALFHSHRLTLPPVALVRTSQFVPLIHEIRRHQANFLHVIPPPHLQTLSTYWKEEIERETCELWDVSAGPRLLVKSSLLLSWGALRAVNGNKSPTSSQPI